MIIKKIRSILKQFFLWSPSIDTLVAASSQVLFMILAYIGLSIFRDSLLSPLIFVVIGTIGVCVFFPLYWIVAVRKRSLDVLGITKRHWLASLLVGLLLGLFSFWGYHRNFGISMAIIPSLIVGVYALWEVIFVYGWLQFEFEEAFGIVPGIVLAGLCFSLYHIGYGWYSTPVLITLFVVGIVYAIIFRFTRNILILWPFLWPISCIRGFKMGGFSPDWGIAGFSAFCLMLMLGLILIFYQIQKGKLISKETQLKSQVNIGS